MTQSYVVFTYGAFGEPSSEAWIGCGIVPPGMSSILEALEPDDLRSMEAESDPVEAMRKRLREIGLTLTSHGIAYGALRCEDLAFVLHYDFRESLDPRHGFLVKTSRVTTSSKRKSKGENDPL